MVQTQLEKSPEALYENSELWLGPGPSRYSAALKGAGTAANAKRAAKVNPFPPIHISPLPCLVQLSNYWKS